MPKSLYSSRECPDSMADRLAAHRFGVFACTVLTVFGSLWISNAMSVREEERMLAGAPTTLDSDAAADRLGIDAQHGVGVPYLRGSRSTQGEAHTSVPALKLEELHITEVK